MARQLVAQVAAVLSIGAGVIHVSAAGDHTNLPVMFAGFIVVATLQVALGAVLFRGHPSKAVIVAGLALMLGSIGVWLVSRTAGLPFLEDGHTEPVGFKDGVTVLFELASLPALLLLLSPDLARMSPLSPRLHSQTLAVVGVACFALLPPALLLGGGEHHTHEEAVELGIHEDHDEGDGLAHAGSDSSHADGEDGRHADRETKGAGDHGHAGSAKKSDRHQHSDVQHAGAPLGSGHEHSGGSAPGGTRDHHGDENGGNHRGDGQHDRGNRDGDKHRGDDHDGDHGDGPNDEQPIGITYGPEPSVCVMDVCFP